MTMSYKLNLWRNPTSGAQRIYVTGWPLERSDKLYIFPAADRLTGKAAWDAKLQSGFRDTHLTHLVGGLGSTTFEIGVALAERALAERGWERLAFAEIARRLEAGEEPAEPVNAPAAATPAAPAPAEEDPEDEAVLAGIAGCTVEEWRERMAQQRRR